MLRLGFERILPFAASLAAVGIVVFAGAAGVRAQQAPKLPVAEDARLALIDYCVIETSRMASQHANITANCRCTVSAVMPQMNESEMQGVVKWRKPTSAIKARWEAAVAGCQ